MKKTVFLLILLPIIILLIQCAGTKGPKLTPEQMEEYHSQTRQADAQFLSGSYTGLKNAMKTYRNYMKYPDLLLHNGDKYIKAGLLLAIREKELGILGQNTLQKVSALTVKKSPFENYSRHVDIVDHIPLNTKGITGGLPNEDEGLDAFFEWTKKNVEPYNTYLKEQSGSSPFYAYLFMSFHNGFAFKFEEPEEYSHFPTIFPDSSLIKFKMATHRGMKKEVLQEIVTKNPEFYEVHYLLGELAMRSGRVLTAEKHYQTALTHIPASTAIVISLTKVFFHLEEFDTCLEYNEKALQLAPDYRDALLGKAMCLGYMGKNQEAIEVLNKMLQLGKYYIGETLYWLSWNQNELDQLDSAQENVTKARDYLIGHYEVSSLDGLIAYKQSRLDEAEKHFKEALMLNDRDCESAYYLGKLYGDKKDWSNSGLYFAIASSCNEKTETSLNARIKEIEKSPLAPGRKESMVRKKKTQLLQTRRTKATCLFNGAAGYFNAKEYDKALELAQKAEAHPSFKDQAAELITAIKQQRIK